MQSLIKASFGPGTSGDVNIIMCDGFGSGAEGIARVKVEGVEMGYLLAQIGFRTNTIVQFVDTMILMIFAKHVSMGAAVRGQMYCKSNHFTS